jgi:hypothetical protein
MTSEQIELKARIEREAKEAEAFENNPIENMVCNSCQ